MSKPIIRVFNSQENSDHYFDQLYSRNNREEIETDHIIFVSWPEFDVKVRYRKLAGLIWKTRSIKSKDNLLFSLFYSLLEIKMV